MLFAKADNGYMRSSKIRGIKESILAHRGGKLFDDVKELDKELGTL